MILHHMTTEELRRAYETDLTEVFPPSELKPLFAMENLRAKGLYDPLCFVDTEGNVLGYILLWRHEDGRFILLDYLCVPARQRNRGIGAKMLTTMREHYPSGTVFIWESEAPTGIGEQDEMILRRLGFYQRCGAKVLGYDCALFGVHFKTLCCADTIPDEKTILQKHREIYLHQFGRARYDRFIQIPLHPGEQPFPVTDWTEDE